MPKIMTVFGTRPEAIKMAPLIKVLKDSSDIETVVCVTAQHREMLDQVLDTFQIVPDYDLDIMQTKQTLSDITARVLNRVGAVLEKEQPDMVLVHGDTSTTFCAALASFYHHIAIGHVEAGLRTYNKYAPFPEEANRQFVGDIADLHFAPTKTAASYLLKEGKKPETVYVTGNTVIDALQYTLQEDYHHAVLDWVKDHRLILLTAHRRENLGEPMYQIFRAILRLVETHQDIKVVYPVHLNPQIKQIAQEVFQNHERIALIEPLDVVDFHNFIQRAYLILTDSGGIQEEAAALGKTVLVLRDTTERPEGLQAGTLKLAGTDEKQIFQMADELLSCQDCYREMSQAANPYGDGKASFRIVDIIRRYLL